MRVLTLDHVHIYASDPERSLAFFVEVLGAEPLGSIAAGDGRRNHFVILGGQILAVSAFPPDLEPSTAAEIGDGAVRGGHGVAHLGLNVDDIDACVRRLQRAGVVVHGAPTKAALLRYVYFTAPDGLVVELTQYDLPPKYRPALAALNALNRTIHETRKLVTGTILKLATQP